MERDTVRGRQARCFLSAQRLRADNAERGDDGRHRRHADGRDRYRTAARSTPTDGRYGQQPLLFGPPTRNR